MARILVVDDDPTVLDVLRRYLDQAGYQVVTAVDGLQALQVFRSGGVDLAVLDLMLPGLDGLEVARLVRRESDVPVVMLTARGEESDRVLGLEIGADDYVVKPFSPRELVLRIGSILRRVAPAEAAPAAQVVDGDLVLDPVARAARLAGADLALTGREFDLLAHFLSHPQAAFTREALLERVWGWSFGDSSTVTVHVRRLREKVEADPSAPQRIVTVWGVGYRYEPVAASSSEPGRPSGTHSAPGSAGGLR
ncbi:MAG: response regulator transcription factor [Actinomycetales bacterium]